MKKTDQIQWHTEKRNLSDLVPADYNPRKITEEQQKQLKKSLEEFGYVETIDINLDNTVIGGHQRLKVLADLGYNEIEVRVPNRKLTKKEEKLLNLRLNKNLADWDYDSLRSDEYDIEMLEAVGFDTDELQMIYPQAPQEIVEDDVPELEEIEPKAQVGDLYQLGNHKLLCGDCTVKENVELLIGDQKVDLMVTDPPYGVNYDPEWRDDADLGVGERSRGKVMNDDVIDWSSVYELFDPSVIYVWHAVKFTHIVAQGLINNNYELISQIVWAKQHFVLSRGDYHWQHEPCWYAVKKGHKHNWQGARDLSTLWQIDNNNSFGSRTSEKEETVGHGTQKPIRCMLFPIVNNSKKGDVICDPFLGSGTTLIACEQTDRICVGCELDPNYCDIIIARWEKFTGKKAVKIN